MVNPYRTIKDYRPVKIYIFFDSKGQKWWSSRTREVSESDSSIINRVVSPFWTRCFILGSGAYL